MNTRTRADIADAADWIYYVVIIAAGLEALADDQPLITLGCVVLCGLVRIRLLIRAIRVDRLKGDE